MATDNELRPETNRNEVESETETETNPKHAVAEVDEKNVRVKKSKEIEVVTLPWESEDFKKMWEIWKNYRWTEKRQKFKSTISEMAQLKHLHDLSAGNEQSAIAIIQQSMGNTWTGLFELKNTNTNGQKQPGNPPVWRK